MSPAAASAARRSPPARPAPDDGFIIGPVADSILLIGSPILALALGLIVSRVPALGEDEITIGAATKAPSELFISAFVLAHLFIVFFRSHGNPKIFARHPVRFTVVPVALFVAMGLSHAVAIGVAVLATWWDVYHSSLQTFGIGRIYDAKAGNDPLVGRRLDWALNLLLYAGPILGGATLMAHVDDFNAFGQVRSVFFTAIPAYAEASSGRLTAGILAVGIPFLVYYVWSYWRLARGGYAVSHQKVLLLVFTSACSIWAWGFNSFGQAFFIMNFFHALQYFAIVWWAEGGNVTRALRLDGRAWGRFAAFVIFIAIAAAFGLWAELADPGDMAVHLAIVVSIMHFWYDGFIWSVRQKQV